MAQAKRHQPTVPLTMHENSDEQIALFVRDEKTGRRAFNALALKALGIERRKPGIAVTRSRALKSRFKLRQPIVAGASPRRSNRPCREMWHREWSRSRVFAV